MSNGYCRECGQEYEDHGSVLLDVDALTCDNCGFKARIRGQRNGYKFTDQQKKDWSLHGFWNPNQ